MPEDPRTHEIPLPGLDAANPLGFLAALGTLVLCGRLFGRPRLSWVPAASGFRPRLHLPAGPSEPELAAALTDRLKDDFKDGAPPPWAEADVIKRPAPDFRHLAHAAAEAATPDDRVFADFVAAFGSEAVTEEKTDRIEPTALSFANGQSGKVLLRDYRDLVRDLEAGHLAAALFAPWRYDDACKTFRWDPRDRRLYAHRAEDPGGSTVFGSHGGNVLGLWGLSLLPTAPTGRGLGTTGVARHRDPGETRSSSLHFTWPVWDAGLGLDTLRGVLADATLQFDEPLLPVGRLRTRGLLTAYRSTRVTYQKGLYLSEPRPLF